MTSKLSNRINNMATSATLAMAAKARELRQAGENIIGLSLGEPDFTVPDFVKDAAVDSDCDHVRIVYGDATLDANGDEVYERYRVTYFCLASELLDPDGNNEATNAIFKQKEEWVNNSWITNGNNSYPQQLITDYVDDLILIAKDEDGVEIDPPPQDDAGNANRMRVFDIRAVEIALTTRSRNNFYNTTTNLIIKKWIFLILIEMIQQ